VRRVFRDAFRVLLPELPVGVDVVLIGSIPRLKPGLEATSEELLKLVHKANKRYLEKLARLEAESAEQSD
jgi:ribonuclease P protein component